MTPSVKTKSVIYPHLSETTRIPNPITPTTTTTPSPHRRQCDVLTLQKSVPRTYRNENQKPHNSNKKTNNNQLNSRVHNFCFKSNKLLHTCGFPCSIAALHISASRLIASSEDKGLRKLFLKCFKVKRMGESEKYFAFIRKPYSRLFET